MGRKFTGGEEEKNREEDEGERKKHWESAEEEKKTHQRIHSMCLKTVNNK